MQLENKKIHETFEDIDLNDMVRLFLFLMIQVEYPEMLRISNVSDFKYFWILEYITLWN